MTLDMTQKSSEKSGPSVILSPNGNSWLLPWPHIARSTYKLLMERKLDVLNESVERHLAFKSRASNTYWRHQWYVSQLAPAFINSRKLGVRT